jgi:hypothetical protein
MIELYDYKAIEKRDALCKASLFLLLKRIKIRKSPSSIAIGACLFPVRRNYPNK